MEIESRKVSDSIVETVHMVRPQHLNASDRLFGGALMQWIDEVAGMVAKRHTRRNVITASVDSLSFLRGAYVKDTVVIIGKVTYVGNTSMEVRMTNRSGCQDWTLRRKKKKKNGKREKREENSV